MSLKTNIKKKDALNMKSLRNANKKINMGGTHYRCPLKNVYSW